MYRLGDRVRVQVVRVDMERRQIDLGLVEVLDALREDERNRGPEAQQGAAEGRARGEEASRQARARHAKGRAVARGQRDDRMQSTG